MVTERLCVLGLPALALFSTATSSASIFRARSSPTTCKAPCMRCHGYTHCHPKAHCPHRGILKCSAGYNPNQTCPTPLARSHRMCTFLMSINVEQRPVYLVRPGHVEKLQEVGKLMAAPKASGPRFLSHMDRVQSLGGSMTVRLLVRSGAVRVPVFSRLTQ